MNGINLHFVKDSRASDETEDYIEELINYLTLLFFFFNLYSAKILSSKFFLKYEDDIFAYMRNGRRLGAVDIFCC